MPHIALSVSTLSSRKKKSGEKNLEEPTHAGSEEEAAHCAERLDVVLHIVALDASSSSSPPHLLPVHANFPLTRPAPIVSNRLCIFFP